MPTTPFQATKWLLRDLRKGGLRVSRSNTVGSHIDTTTGAITIARGHEPLPPVGKLWHEAGHAAAAKGSFKSIIVGAIARRDGRAADASLANLRIERSANKSALALAGAYGLPRAERKNYIDKVAKPQFRGYRARAASDGVPLAEIRKREFASKKREVDVQIHSLGNGQQLIQFGMNPSGLFGGDAPTTFASAPLVAKPRTRNSAGQFSATATITAGLLRKAYGRLALKKAVPQPIAFSRPQESEPKRSVLEPLRRVANVLGGAALGRYVGESAVPLLQRRKIGGRRISKTKIAERTRIGGMIGAGVGAIAGAYEPQERRLHAKVREVLFGRADHASIHEIIDATKRQIPDAPGLPFEDEVRTGRKILRNAVARRAALRALTVAGLAGIGALAGQKLGGNRGAKAGLVAGAAAGSIL